MDRYEDISKYENMMYAILKRYNLLHKKDDYIDLCYIGYSKALKTYDSSTSFSTYAYTCMENEIKQELRKQTRKKRIHEETSLDFMMEDNSVHDIISDNYNLENNILSNEENKKILENIKCLENNQQIYIIELCINKLTRDEISKKYDINVNKLKAELKMAYNKLRDYF